MTSAPCSRAQSTPRATSSMLPPPSSPSTRTGISVAPGATLSTPTPLPVAAPMIAASRGCRGRRRPAASCRAGRRRSPARCGPRGRGGRPGRRSRSRPRSRRRRSTTARAPSASIRSRFHCSPRRGSAAAAGAAASSSTSRTSAKDRGMVHYTCPPGPRTSPTFRLPRATVEQPEVDVRPRVGELAHDLRAALRDQLDDEADVADLGVLVDVLLEVVHQVGGEPADLRLVEGHWGHAPLYAITYARMEVGTPVGSRVRALRESMDLSLRDLAERSGVSAPMLSQVERGETSPTLTIAGRIAAGLELRLSQLLRLDEGGTVSVVRPQRAPHRRRRRPPLGGPHPAAARPARRGLLPHRPARRPHRRPRRPADARARRARDEPRPARAP